MPCHPSGSCVRSVVDVLPRSCTLPLLAHGRARCVPHSVARRVKGIWAAPVAAGGAKEEAVMLRVGHAVTVQERSVPVEASM